MSWKLLEGSTGRGWRQHQTYLKTYLRTILPYNVHYLQVVQNGGKTYGAKWREDLVNDRKKSGERKKREEKCQNGGKEQSTSGLSQSRKYEFLCARCLSALPSNFPFKLLPVIVFAASTMAQCPLLWRWRRKAVNY